MRYATILDALYFRNHFNPLCGELAPHGTKGYFATKNEGHINMYVMYAMHTTA